MHKHVGPRTDTCNKHAMQPKKRSNRSGKRTITRAICTRRQQRLTSPGRVNSVLSPRAWKWARSSCVPTSGAQRAPKASKQHM